MARRSAKEIMLEAIKLGRRDARRKAAQPWERVAGLAKYKDPKYSWERKLIHLGNYKPFRDRKLWARLPNSAEVLLQISYLDLDEESFKKLMAAVDGQGHLLIDKKTTLAKVKAICKAYRDGEPLEKKTIENLLACSARQGRQIIGSRKTPNQFCTAAKTAGDRRYEV